MRAASYFAFVSLLATAAAAASYGPGFKQTMVPVEGCTLSATVGGQGPTVLLLHGYAETGRMWKPLALALASAACAEFAAIVYRKVHCWSPESFRRDTWISLGPR